MFLFSFNTNFIVILFKMYKTETSIIIIVVYFPGVHDPYLNLGLLHLKNISTIVMHPSVSKPVAPTWKYCKKVHSLQTYKIHAT